jgi:Rrf2 family iron-sulfur cluster assembly transcriptional regulator
LVVENKPSLKRAIAPMPISQPIRVNVPNSVFDLGNMFAKS